MLSASAAAIDSTSAGLTKSEQNQAKLEEDLNQFLNLLVTQLKNQDPLEPMDATEFTNQLVQFASVEQQIYQNSNLEKLLNAYHVTQVSSLTGYLGNTVEANGDTFMMENSQAKFSYTLYDTAAENTILVTNADGETVYSFSGGTEEGRHEFNWDGTDAAGNQLPDGLYTVTANPKDGNGELLEYSQTVYGKVTSAGADEGQVTLFIDQISVPLDDVVSVAETPAAPAAP